MISWVRKNQERRQTTRYSVPEGTAALPIAVVRQDANSTLGQLVDLSQQGAKLCLESVLQFSEEVILRLVLPSQDVSLAINSTIVWTRAAPDGRFLVGCSFEKAIPASVIDRLAGVGLINRRRHPREAVHLEAEARWQLSPTPVQAVVLDYSLGGFRMRCSVPEKVSQGVRLNFPSGEAVFGVVKWNRLEEDSLECGCEFLRVAEGQEGAEIIRRLALAQAEPV